MTTDAATAALVAVRARVQALHEAVDAVPAPGAAGALRDAAARLAALLASLGPVLDPARTDAPRRELVALATTAGAVRDAEVLGELVDELLAEIPRALVVGPLADRVRRHLRARRSEGVGALTAAVRDEQGVATLRAVDRLVITPPLGEAAGAKAAKVLARCARADDEHLAAAVAALGPDPAQGQASGWSPVREAALALSCSAGAAAPEHGKKAAKLAGVADELAAGVESMLDAVRVQRLLVDLADLAHRHREPGFTYGLLHAGAARRETLARAAVDRALDDLAEDKRRSWM